uniref:regulatory protein RecX n=1 Tax=Eubacterium cellulosolvens TaxID=29322 RepID=UPI00138AE0E9|nr:regulatory protein RecX [[Eubacterium] cellulosolvens]
MKEWKIEGRTGTQMETPEGEGGKAAVRAMKLLLYKQRSEQELRKKLLEEFGEDAIEEAVKYCASFGYVNDRKYAENYLLSYRNKKSANVIRRELEQRGVATAVIDEAFGEHPYEEREIVDELVRKKAGAPRKLDDRELRRTYAYLARKGFSSSVIWGAIHRFQDEAPYED